MEINALHFLRPKIRVGNSDYAAKQLQYLLKSSKRKRSSRYAFARGSSIFFREHSRDRRVIVKVSYAKNTTKRSWAAHGRYLQREHAQAVNQKGLGFSELQTEVNLKETLKIWQHAKDPHFFKIILSPENADKLDLKAHTRELMEQVSRDLNTKIEWIAIDHHNTDQDHVHILVRGIDEKGEGLTIEPNYISDGIRKRSQEIVTRKLGLRTLPEMNRVRAKQIHKEYVTEIDRALRFRSQDGIVSFGKLKQDNASMREKRLQDIQRLKFLETLNLAERVGDKIWRLSPQLESTLKAMQLSNDIIKSRAQHGLSISEYANVLSNTSIEQGSGVIGKVIGINLENTPQITSSLSSSAIDAMTLTDMDRCLRMKSVDGVVHYEKAIPYSFNARKQRLNEIARLKFLESVNLAEKIGAKRWRLSETLEKELSKLQPNLAANQNHLASPTVIDGDHPLTGKVVGMGLDNELHDRRYILMEGLDGKIHYVRATESIVKLRDQFKMKNGDIISLRQRIFHSEEEKKSIAYLHLDPHGQDVSNLKISVLDEVLMNHIKIKNCFPDFELLEKTFGESFKLQMQTRVHELVINQIIDKQENEWHLNVNHLNLLDDLHHRSHGEFITMIDFIAQSKKEILGKVIESNERVMLIKNSHGQNIQIQNTYLGIENGLKKGSELYLRPNTPPNFDLTKTDERLSMYVLGNGYCPVDHRNALFNEFKCRADFFLKSEEAIDDFVLAHQRRADTWVKWGFFIQENGIYKMNPEFPMSEKVERVLVLNGNPLLAVMENHLQCLKAKHDIFAKKHPYLFTLLKSKTIKVDKHKFVLLDRMLCSISFSENQSDFEISKKLQERKLLWQSRGIEIGESFEKKARRWLGDSLTLQKVQKKQNKPLFVVRDTSLKTYSGKVVALGSCDDQHHTYLVLKTEKELLAFMMRPQALMQYQLDQEIELKYRYRNFIDHKIQKQKRLKLSELPKK